MTQQKIQEFNKQLISLDEKITIIDYTKKLNGKFYNIDINFIDEFINMVDKDDFIVHHNQLEKYEILKINNNTGHVKRLFEQHEFEEQQDYKCELSGSGYGLEYFLKPEIFKILLIRSKHTKRYAQYYILLEKCIKYYNDYEKLKLEQKINEINEIKLLKLDHSETLDNFIIFKCDIETLIVSKYNNKKYSEKHDYNTYPYAMVKGQDKNIEHTMSECNLKASNIMIKIKVPSQCNFTKRVRELLKNKFKRLVRFYREININGNENIREYLMNMRMRKK